MIITDVIDFNMKYGLPHGERDDLTSKIVDLTNDEIDYRLGFLEEEYLETKKAFKENNTEEIIDGLLDLVYVAIGTLTLMEMSEVQIREHWSEIQRANMTKERSSGDGDVRSKRGHSLDVVKPEGWTPPDHQTILKKYADE